MLFQFVETPIPDLMMVMPRVFADERGFVVLSEAAEFVYKTTAEYAPAADGGIVWNDPALGIQWPIAPEAALVSEKDSQLPTLKELDEPYL
jgi:dTDP-4-dehydrorhamnose 3,5-epimerase